MKKMPYAFIFIIILALLVFAGCKAFTETPSDSSGTETEEPTSSEDPFEDEQFTGEDEETVSSEDESSSAEDEFSSVSEENSSGDTSNAGSTTAPSDRDEKTTAEPTAEPTAGTATTESVAGVNEYDVLRSNQFYMEGTLYADGVPNPMAIAMGDGLVYMQTSMDGASMGFLISGGNTYLLNPSEKTYCEFGSLLSGILSQAGMMGQDEMLELMQEMGFSSMDDLSEADEINKATLNGTACTVYIFNRSDETKTRVFMDGDRLLAFEIVGPGNIVDTATYINKITPDIPTLPPADYTKQNLIAFMTSLESILGD